MSDAEPAFELGSQVAIATMALLCYQLLFWSPREPTLTALLFCGACAWCAGQLAGGAGGGVGGFSGVQPVFDTVRALFSLCASVLGSSVRLLCQHVGLEAGGRDACWSYTSAFMPAE